MKKQIILIFIILLVLIILIIHNQNKDTYKLYDNPIKINQEYENYTYNEFEDHITILTYNGNEEEVIIPESINSKPVYSIDDSAFYGNSSLKKVTIPNSVVRIGHQSFIGDKYLEEVILSDNIVDLGQWSFKQCVSLKKIYIKKGSVSENTLKNSDFSKYIAYK